MTILRHVGATIAGLALMAYGGALLSPTAQPRLLNFVLRAWGSGKRVDPDSWLGRSSTFGRGLFYIAFGFLVLLIGLGLG